MNQTDREAPKQTTPCPECGAPCIIKWSGLELVENTGDETLATKHYMFADKQLEELKQEQIETAQRIDATQDMHEKELEELRAELDSLKHWKKSAEDVINKWNKVDEFVRLHPDVKIGESVSGKALELLQQNAELKAELEDRRVENNRLLSKLSDVEAAKEDLLNMINEIRGTLYARDTSDEVWHALDKIFSKTEFKYDSEDFE